MVVSKHVGKEWNIGSVRQDVDNDVKRGENEVVEGSDNVEVVRDEPVHGSNDRPSGPEEFEHDNDVANDDPHRSTGGAAKVAKGDESASEGPGSFRLRIDESSAHVERDSR